MSVQFSLLGPVEVRVDGQLVDVGHARRQCVLTALLVDANHAVPVPELVHRVWGERRLPSRPVNALQTYVSLLRRSLAGTCDAAITRQPAGYRMAVDPAAVDLYRFQDLRGQARNAADSGDDESSAALFEEALRLWRGTAFASLDTGWINIVRVKLENQRLAAELDLTDVRLRRGQHAELLGDLCARVAEHPLDERLTGQLMLALYCSGRQAEALDHYQRTRRRLGDELGADPGRPLQELHQRILAGDPALAGRVPRADAARPPVARPRQRPPSTRLIPFRARRLSHSGGFSTKPARIPAVRQLPTDVAGFVGRCEQLARLDALLANPDDGKPAAVAVIVVSGMAGVGKTALAVHWAHRQRDRFPDGQLYVNLRGFEPTGSMLSAGDTLRRFLDALGVAPQRIPPELDAQAALYRSEVAGRRMLILLDNARDAPQVRPLLPGTPGCQVLLTSRNSLSGLVAAEGVCPVILDPFTDEEAHELLACRLGTHRVSAEPDAVGEIIPRCARLPVALAIVAARAATRPHLPLRVLAEQLRDASLDILGSASDPATDIRTVFSSSYRALAPPAARLFRLLGLHCGPDITTLAAASLAGVPVGVVRPLLDELTQANLVIERISGRYALHDLVHAYAGDLTERLDTDEERQAATHRVLDHYLHTAHAADLLLDPVADPVTPAPPQPEVTLQRLTDRQQALDWFIGEYPVLLTAVTHAAATGWEVYCGQLAWTLWTFLDRQGHWHDQATLGRAAVTAAARLADPPEQARAHRLLAHAHTRLGRFADAETELRHALDRYRDVDDQEGQAHTHYALAHLAGQWNRPDQALDHAQQSLDLYRAAGHHVGQANTLNQVGWYQALLGNHQHALACCHQALALHQKLGHRVGQASAWDSLGYAHHRLGNHTKATTCYQRALTLHHDLGNHYYEATTLTHLGDIQHHRGHTEAAADAWQQALTILDDLKYPATDELRDKLAGLSRTPTSHAGNL